MAFIIRLLFAIPTLEETEKKERMAQARKVKLTVSTSKS